jgi:hypothetical protein
MEDAMTRRTAAVFVTGLLISWAIVAPAMAAEPPSNASDDDAAGLKAAREERVKVLTELVDLLRSQYKIGKADPAQVFSAETDLCNAQLDLTDDAAKRIALLTKLLEKADAFLKLSGSRHRAEHVSPGYLLQARSLYLETKIKLLRERSVRN